MTHCTCEYGTVAVGIVEPPTHDPDCPIHAVPSPIQPWTPLTAEDKRKVGEWMEEFAKTLPATTTVPPRLRQRVDWPAEIARWQDDNGDAHEFAQRVAVGRDARVTVRQRSSTTHRRAAPSPSMVDTEEESTPVVEGWGKPKPWWARLWRRMRAKR